MTTNVLLCLLVIFGFLSTLCFYSKRKIYGFVFCILGVLVVVWSFVALFSTRVVKYENVYTVENVGSDLDKTQIIVIPEEGMKIINLNRLLGKTFPEGTRIKRVVWQDVYYGIRFDPEFEYLVVKE